MTAHRLSALLAFSLVVALMGGCTEDGGKPGDSTGAPGGTATTPGGNAGAPGASAGAPGPSAAAATGGAVVQERAVYAAGDRLTVGVEPLVRQGETVVLTLRVALGAGSTGRGAVSRYFTSGITNAFDGARLVDTTGRTVWTVAENGDGGCVCTTSLRLDEGESNALQAAFAAVPAGVDKLSVMLPYAGVFVDVPVTAGAVPAPPEGKDLLGRTYEPLDLASAVARSAGLDAYTDRLDVGLRTKRTADKVDLDLASDVLFRLDSAALTGAARRTLDAAVSDLRAAGPGPLTVTGHTDDSGTEAHNRALSRQRADAVAAELRKKLPADKWPMTVAAKGESAPAVPNDSADHRARNRRVTVSAKAGTAAAAAKVPDVPLPKTAGKVAAAGKGADVTLPLRRGTLRFTAGEARVLGAFAQVDLVATNAGTEKATIHDLLGQGVFTVRDEFDPYARYGAAGVRMIAGGTVSYGLDYALTPGNHRCLCDRLLNQAIPAGGTQVISLWFPAPPAGTTTVTLDVPDTLRLTGVPVRA